MASKSKEVRIEQKSYWKAKLDERLEVLAERGADPTEAAKDPAVRKIRASLRETESRLQTIASLETKAEEMAQKKAAKKDAPKKEKGKKAKQTQETVEMSKRQQKKKKKKEAKA
jgi:hypothetical protein